MAEALGQDGHDASLTSAPNDVRGGVSPDRGVTVNAQGARGLIVGDSATQVNYIYYRSLPGDGPTTPLIDGGGLVRNPYRGLGAFRGQDAPLFCGRDGTIAELGNRLAAAANDGAIMVVSGVSGAGKSSLLQAGVLPRIAGEGLPGLPEAASWPVLLLQPGATPLSELAAHIAQALGTDAADVRRSLAEDPGSFATLSRQAALAAANGSTGADSRLLIVVDQFEQIYTQCGDDAERAAFIRALVGATTGRPAGAVLVISVRADAEARLAEDFPPLADAVRGRFLVTAMDEAHLRLAITEPATRAGARVESALVDEIIREMAVRPITATGRERAASGDGALPHLSYALDQAWRARTHPEVLTLKDYLLTGGIDKAVAKAATEAMDRLGPEHADATRRVFLSLAGIDEEGRGFADRVARADLGPEPEVSRVIEAFAADRLIIVGDVVQISHEALLRAWPLLQGWLEESREDRLLRARLRAAATEWTATGDNGLLYRGLVLERAEQAVRRAGAKSHQPLAGTERRFLTASTAAVRRAVRVRRTFLSSLMILSLALAVIAGYAFVQRNDAVRQTVAAQQAQRVAVSRQLAADSKSLLDTDPDLASLLAVAAYRTSPTAEAIAGLDAAASQPLVRRMVGGPGDRATAVAFSPDGHVVATADDVGVIRLRDVASGATDRFLLDHGELMSIEYSPDGRSLLTASLDGTARLWDIATGTSRVLQVPGAVQMDSAAFSPDGRTIATAGSDGKTVLWDTATLTVRATIAGSGYSIVYSPDGRTLATSHLDSANPADNNIIQLWDTSTDKLRLVVQSQGDGGIESMAFSPDGKTLAEGTFNGPVRVWDVATGGLKASFPGRGGITRAVAYSRDGQTLAVGGEDGSVQLWNLMTRSSRATFVSHADTVTAIAFSPDGQLMATAQGDGTTRLYSASAGSPAQTLSDPAGEPVDSVAYSPDGLTLAAGYEVGNLRTWSLSTGQTRVVDTKAFDIFGLAFTRDGQTLITTGNDPYIRGWRVDTLQGRKLAEAPFALMQLATTPNGEWIAAGGRERPVLWNVTTGAGRVLSSPGNTWALAFSPDNDTLAASDVTGNVVLVDAATGAVTATLLGTAGTVTALAFSPDGHTLATGSTDGTVRLWDVASAASRAVLSTHTVPVNALQFSPDGRTIAAGGDDGTVWLINAAMDTVRLTYPASSSVRALAFSPNGSRLAAGSSDGKVRIWDTSSPDATSEIGAVCRAVGRDFTHDEELEYLQPQTTTSACPSSR